MNETKNITFVKLGKLKGIYEVVCHRIKLGYVSKSEGLFVAYGNVKTFRNEAESLNLYVPELKEICDFLSKPISGGVKSKGDGKNDC